MMHGFMNDFFAGGFYRWFGMGGGVMFLTLLVVLGIVIYFVLRSNNNFDFGNNKSAQDILDKRYANGEITREEYLMMKEDIKNKHDQ